MVCFNVLWLVCLIYSCNIVLLFIIAFPKPHLQLSDYFSVFLFNFSSFHLSVFLHCLTYLPSYLSTLSVTFLINYVVCLFSIRCYQILHQFWEIPGFWLYFYITSFPFFKFLLGYIFSPISSEFFVFPLIFIFSFISSKFCTLIFFIGHTIIFNPVMRTLKLFL